MPAYSLIRTPTWKLMTTDDADSGWDSLAQEFGLDAGTPPPKKDKSDPPPKSPTRSPTPRAAPDPRPEIEDEVDDFGAGIAEAPARPEAYYDPGPDAVADDTEEFDDSDPEPLEDDAGEDIPTADDTAESEGGKRRRRRRRRKKKGGPGGPEKETADVAEAPSLTEEDDETVEEGEAPAEVEEDDDEPAPPTAVDEEMDAEAAGPRPEWHVMTWMELVSKLYRPS
jgi:hypothetical protein